MDDEMILKIDIKGELSKYHLGLDPANCFSFPLYWA